MPKFQIVTVADRDRPEPYYRYRSFLKSCRRFGHDPVVLGWGEPFMGLGTKPRLLHWAIANGRVNADVIIFCDAYDVFFSEDPESLLANIDERIIFNAEKSCFPDASLAPLHPETTSPWKYLNSGLSIGPLDAYAQCLKAMDAPNLPNDIVGVIGQPNRHFNDQLDWSKLFVSNDLPIRLDTDCVHFQTYCGVTPDEIDLTGTHIRNKVTNTHPSVHHLNGGAKSGELAEPVLRKLGLL